MPLGCIISSIPAADVVDDCEIIDSDIGENTGTSDDDDDDDDDDKRDKGSNDNAGNASFPGNSDSDDDAGDSNDAEVNRSHKPLTGNFKTAEGISVSVVKGSIAAQKVSMSIPCVHFLVTIMTERMGIMLCEYLADSHCRQWFTICSDTNSLFLHSK